MAARRLMPNLSVGVAVRERNGSLDDVSRSGVSVDGLDSVPGVRLGIVLHYAGYCIGEAREDGVNGLAPTYQFPLSSLLK